MAVTLLILNGFSIFFRSQILQQICSKVCIRDPTAPHKAHMYRYTTLWNISTPMIDSRKLMQ